MSLQNPLTSQLAPTSLTPQQTTVQLVANIDLLISLSLHSWQALTIAIQNSWGGSPQESKDKRDWFAGAISELLNSNPPQIAHLDDLEEVLLQVMVDEFEVVVDDDSAFEVAQKIWKGREKVIKGDLVELEQMYSIWLEKQRKYGTTGEKINVKRVEQDEGDQDTDWDEDDEEEWNGFDDQDEEMAEAPSLVDASRKAKAQPEVDEDGFTKVIGKKKR